jgi:hypothetical protein
MLMDVATPIGPEPRTLWFTEQLKQVGATLDSNPLAALGHLRDGFRQTAGHKGSVETELVARCSYVLLAFIDYPGR